MEGLLVSGFPGYGYGGKFWTHAGDGIYLASGRSVSVLHGGQTDRRVRTTQSRCYSLPMRTLCFFSALISRDDDGSGLYQSVVANPAFIFIRGFWRLDILAQDMIA